MKMYVLVALLSIASCKNTADRNISETGAVNESQAPCSPVLPDIDHALHAKVLVVPANMGEYNYFMQVMARYQYAAESKPYGMRYSGRERSHLVVTLLKPGKKVTAKYGIVQLKGHTSDMEQCFSQAQQCIVPNKTILISGGCESSRDVCKYASLNIPAFTINHIGRGPVNDYLVLQMQSLLQDYSYQETVRKLNENAPVVMAEYTYPH